MSSDRQDGARGGSSASSASANASAKGEADELESLQSLMASPTAVLEASGADDDKIDLRALTQLASRAPRPIGDAALPSLDEASARATDERFADSMRAPAARRFPLRTLATLLLGFAVGVPVGGFMFSGTAATVTPAPADAVSAPGVPPSTFAASAPSVPAPAAGPSPSASPAAVAAPVPSAPQPSAAAVVVAGQAPNTAAALASANASRSVAPSSTASARPPAAASAASASTRGAAVASSTPRGSAAAHDPSPVATVRKSEAAHDAAPLPPAAVAEAPKPAPGDDEPRSMDKLLDDAVPTMKHEDPVGVLTRDPDALPPTPSREEVSSAMAVLLPAIRGCAMGQVGMATAGIVVQNDGKVASVSVTGSPFAGSASGRCMEGVVRRARFPRFKQPSFRVQFPFAIQ